jgi:hypothetical protein
MSDVNDFIGDNRTVIGGMNGFIPLNHAANDRDKSVHAGKWAAHERS